MWRELNHINITKKSIRSLPQNIAHQNTLNSYFLDLPRSNYDTNLSDSAVTHLSSAPVDESEIFNIFTKIKSRCIGADVIGTDALNLCIPFLLPISAIVFPVLFSVYMEGSNCRSYSKSNSSKRFKEYNLLTFFLCSQTFWKALLRRNWENI